MSLSPSGRPFDVSSRREPLGTKSLSHHVFFDIPCMPKLLGWAVYLCLIVASNMCCVVSDLCENMVCPVSDLCSWDRRGLENMFMLYQDIPFLSSVKASLSKFGYAYLSRHFSSNCRFIKHYHVYGTY